MPGEFEQDGISFKYPDNWTLQREDGEQGWTVSVSSPATAFFMLTYDNDMPEPALMIETALEALRSEYPDLESDEVVESIAGQPAIGHDIRFFSFDLTNTIWTRSFYSEAGTLLALWQSNDLELESVEILFKAMKASLHIESERD